MYAVVGDFHAAVDTDLFVQVNVVLTVDVANHWIPASKRNTHLLLDVRKIIFWSKKKKPCDPCRSSRTPAMSCVAFV